MHKRLLRVTVLGFSLTLIGCDSLLYSDTLAPVFSSKNPQRQMPPPTVQMPKAIENPNSNMGVVVQQAENNPYANVPARPADMTNTASVGRHSATLPATVDTDSANNPRVQEGTEVLASQANNTAVAQRPGSTVSQQAASTATKATNPASSQTATTETSTTTTTTTSSASTATASTAKAKPATPQTATRALLQEARSAVSAGNYDKAASALERAHRIEPGNAKILYDIAQIRYAQGKYRQAASFASKAATYSSSPTLSKKVWTLLSNARKQLGNSTGAAAAAQKAASF